MRPPVLKTRLDRVYSRQGFMRRTAISYFLTFLLCAGVQGARTVQIDFFYEPGCTACERIEALILPELERRFAGAYELRARDIGMEAHFISLLELEHQTGYTGAERAYLAVNRQKMFGADLSTEDFFASVQSALDQDAVQTDPDVSADGPDLLNRRFKGFTLSAVIAAGLLDGINPCAISTLVFFMSLLAVSKVKPRNLVLLGLSFCTASFLTYLALGFGLFRVLHLFTGLLLVRLWIERIMLSVLLVLAGLSFRDAVRFRRSGRSSDVTLQLSAGMKKRVHAIMRRGLGGTGIVLGGLFIGTFVTALESVCTGQVYVPVLVLILKESSYYEPRAWLYLLVYNLMFILPLAAVFIAVYFGVQTETLLAWSRKNVVVSKILLGFLFLVMALLMVLL